MNMFAAKGTRLATQIFGFQSRVFLQAILDTHIATSSLDQENEMNTYFYSDVYANSTGFL